MSVSIDALAHQFVAAIDFAFKRNDNPFESDPSFTRVAKIVFETRIMTLQHLAQQSGLPEREINDWAAGMNLVEVSQRPGKVKKLRDAVASAYGIGSS